MSIARKVAAAKPLVHCITNSVTVDWVANGLLAAGARPVMVLDRSESGIMAAAASALLLNIGTWRPEQHEAMLVAGMAANAAGVPVVLDPVGAGALAVRTARARELLDEVRVAAIRGNAGEIAALAGQAGRTRGVDSAMNTRESGLASAAGQVARRYGCLVVATGAVDIVTDGHRTLLVKGGHPMMDQICGSGCLNAALLASAFAAGGIRLETAAEAMLWVSYAGELTVARCGGPGSYVPAYLDTLACMGDLPEGRIAPPLADRLALYVLVSGSTPHAVVESVLAQGVQTIQWREKDLPLTAQLEAVTRLRAMCRKAGALLLINDRVDLAQAVGADGVHVGQDDMPAAVARKLLGPEAIIGVSCHDVTEAEAAVAAGADYIGTGAIYATGSKSDTGGPKGPAVVTAVARAVSLPVVGIGGISLATAGEVIRAGACGVAVINAVLGAPDPAAAATALLEAIRAARAEQVVFPVSAKGISLA